MAKKNNIRKLFESTDIESADAHPAATPSDQAEQPESTPPAAKPEQGLPAAGHDREPDIEDASAREAGFDAGDPQEGAGASAAGIEGEQEGLPAEAGRGEAATDDVLDDVRRALIEEADDRSQEEPSWWRRLGRKAKRPDPVESPAPVEIDLPKNDSLPAVVDVPFPEQETKEEIDEIEDLIDLLAAESRTETVKPSAAPEVQSISEPEPEVDFEERKKQAFQPRAGTADQESISDVRSIALGGGEEVLVEVEAKAVDPLDERLKAFENALKPYRSYIYYAMALLGVGMAVVAGLILFNVYQQSRPEPVQQPSDLPYPTSVSLPGGWSFQLGRGTVQNGAWDPAGAEWLEGTEVCRWVSLPWSTQLEAVVRTLNPDDPIELVMSNNDKLVYEVHSIRELSREEMQQLDSNSPCLLLILSGSETEKRWVLTALP